MQLPFILSIPHCGLTVPADIRREIALEDRQIEESVDFGTYEIFSAFPAKAVLSALWSRLVVDLNRNPRNRDPKGVVALTDYHGRPVFKPGFEPSAQMIDQRVRQYHAPYNAALQNAMRSKEFNVLFDCHSLNGVGPADAPDAGQRRKDITLSNYGDRQGRPNPDSGPITCPTNLFTAMAEAFRKQGFSVSLNNPYKGGYIIQHYAPRLLEAGRAAVQIEMNQDLYMRAGDTQPDLRQIQGVTARLLQALGNIADILGT